MKRTSAAKWRGNLKEGRGLLSTESGSLLNTPYSWAKRFGSESGTNPEELIGAAHAGCFAMQMSAELEKMGLKADFIDVRADVSLEKGADGWGIPRIHLEVEANVPGASESQINQAANSAKVNCPVGKLLKAEISMDAHMDKHHESATEMGISD
jgi:osmotically inducible protein OsmC